MAKRKKKAEAEFEAPVEVAIDDGVEKAVDDMVLDAEDEEPVLDAEDEEPVLDAPEPETQAELSSPPSIEEIIRDGHSLEEAQKILAEAREKYEQARSTSHPHYKIKCPSRKGYWKIGRHFVHEEVILYLEDLSDAEVLELERAHPLHLTIVRFGFEPLSKEEIRELENPESKE